MKRETQSAAPQAETHEIATPLSRFDRLCLYVSGYFDLFLARLYRITASALGLVIRFRNRRNPRRVAITPENYARISHLAEMIEGTRAEVANKILGFVLNEVYEEGRLAEYFATSWAYEDEDEARRIIGNLQRHDSTVPGSVITKWVFVTGDDGLVRVDYPSRLQAEVAA